MNKIVNENFLLSLFFFLKVLIVSFLILLVASFGLLTPERDFDEEMIVVTQEKCKRLLGETKQKMLYFKFSLFHLQFD